MKNVVLFGIICLLSISALTAQTTPPANLAGIYDMDAGVVNLKWSSPGAWLTQGSANPTMTSGVGDGGPANVAHRFTANQLATSGAAGKLLTDIRVYARMANSTIYIRAWEDGYMGDWKSDPNVGYAGYEYHPGTLLLDQLIVENGAPGWHLGKLDVPLQIPVGKEFWIGYVIYEPTNGFNGAVEDYPNDGYSNLAFDRDAQGWYALSAWGTWGEPYSFMLQGFYELDGARVQVLSPNIIEDPIPTVIKDSSILKTTGKIKLDPNPTQNYISNLDFSQDLIVNPLYAQVTRENRALLGYDIRRGATDIIAQVTTKEYTDTTPGMGNVNYAVRAHYDEGDSDWITTTVNVQKILPVTLTAVQASLGANQVNISWTLPTLLEGQPAQMVSHELWRNENKIMDLDLETFNYIDYDVRLLVTYKYYMVTKYTQNFSATTPILPVLIDGNPAGENAYPPRNLTANVSLDNVTLHWDVPEPVTPANSLHHYYYSDENEIIAYGSGSANETVRNGEQYIRFSPDQLQNLFVSGAMLTTVDFYFTNYDNSNLPNVMISSNNWKVNVYTGGTGFPVLDTGTKVATVPIPRENIVAGWNVITLPTPVTIPWGEELWLSFEFDRLVHAANQGVYWITSDDKEVVPLYGNLYRDVFGLYIAEEDGITGNAVIRGTVVTPTGAPVHITPQNTAFKPNPTHQSMLNPKYQISRFNSQNTQTSTRTLTGYNVYRGTTRLNDSLITGSLEFFAPAQPQGTHIYSVKALYSTGGESGPVSTAVLVRQIYNVEISNSSPYTQNFEGNAFPEDWIAYNVGPYSGLGAAGGGWVRATSGGNFGPRNVASRSRLNSVTGYDPDAYLITPRFDLRGLSAGESVRLDYYIGNQDTEFFTDKYEVLVSTTGYNPQEFTVLSPAVTLDTAAWTLKSIDLTSFIGEQIFVAFRHFDSFHKGNIRIDDVSVQTGVGTVDDPTISLNNALQGNYPNPFNPETTITYSVKEKSIVVLEVFNVKGQKVKTLVNGPVEAGNRQVIWNGTDDKGQGVSSGMYFYRMKTDGYSATKRMMLIK